MYDGITLVRKCSAGDVRKLCIKYNLFTWGDVEHYNKMLDEVAETKNWEDFAVIETARNIVWYSDTDKEDVFSDCNTMRQCIVRVANLIESECIKSYYEQID